MRVEPIANKLILKYKSRDPFTIVENMNAYIVYAPLKGVRGFYQYFQRNNIIYIDESLPDHEKRLVCAHELGHMMLHRKTNTYRINAYTSLNTTKYEKEANRFAMYLLISDADLEEYREREYTIGQIAQLYGFSESLIKLRLEEDI